jgi:hypothetical protein
MILILLLGHHQSSIPESRKVDLDSTREIYFKEGGARLLSKLGDSIVVLKLETSLFDNMIPSLDASEVCPSEMEFADTSLSSTRATPHRVAGFHHFTVCAQKEVCVQQPAETGTRQLFDKR